MNKDRIKTDTYKILIIVSFILLFNDKIYSQNFSIIASQKYFYSIMNHENSAPGNIFNKTIPKCNSLSIGLSFNRKDLNYGIDAEFINRKISTNFTNDYIIEYNSPIGSTSVDSFFHVITFNGAKKSFALKANFEYMIKLLNNKILLLPAISLGIDFHRKLFIYEDYFSQKIITHRYDSYDSSYHYSLSLYESKASLSELHINQKNMLFADVKLKIFYPIKKFQFSLIMGARNYYSSVVSADNVSVYVDKSDSYKTQNIYFSRDKFWEIGIGYKIK